VSWLLLVLWPALAVDPASEIPHAALEGSGESGAGTVQIPSTPRVDSSYPWLPLDGPWASVRLHDGVDPATLGSLLDRGRPLRSAPIWRVPTADVPALVDHPAVAAVWGLPEPVPPPDEADLPPQTPDFTADQAWRAQLGLTRVSWWPGGQGAGVRVVDIEYSFDPTHEDLINNPPLTLGGLRWREFVYHGNSSLGLVGASDDGFGTTGAAPLAELAVMHPIIDTETYDVAAAVELATLEMQPGDVLLIEQQAPTGRGLGPVTIEPGAWEAVRAAVDAGIHVVEPAGNGAVDLDHPDFAGWFSRDNDSGAIMVGALEPDGATWNGSSSYGTRVDLCAVGRQLPAPSWDDGRGLTDLFYPDQDPRQAYTSRFGGTSGASAQVAGLVAAVQGAAFELRSEAIPPEQLRAWLRQSGTPQESASAAEHPVGVRPDAQRVIRAWLAW